MENIPTPTNPSIWPPKREIVITLILQVIIVGCTAFLAYNLGVNSRNKIHYVETPPATLIPSPTSSSIPRACTKDVKQCSDGSYVVRSGPTCEFAACPGEAPQSKLLDRAFILSQYQNKTDANGSEIPNTRGDIFIVLPVGSTIVDKTATINGVSFTVQVNVVVGPCAMDASEKECSYIDTKTSNGGQLRLWKNTKGIFALNLMPAPMNGYSLSSVVVTKSGKDMIFTQSEMNEWEKIFLTLGSVPSESTP